MLDISQLLNTSPSVELLRLRNREMAIEFFVQIFPNKQGTVSSENIHIQLTDFLEGRDVEQDEDSEVSLLDTHETKAKQYIANWTSKGFLTNCTDEALLSCNINEIKIVHTRVK